MRLRIDDGAVITIFAFSLLSLGPFVFVTFGLAILSASIVLFPSAGLSNFLQLLDIPFSFRVFILVLAGVHLFCAFTAEHVFFPIIASWIGKLLHDRKRSSAVKTQQQEQSQRQPLPQSQTRTHQTYRIDEDDNSDDDDNGQGSGSRPSTPLMSSTEDSYNKVYPSEQQVRPGTKIYKMVEEEMNEV